MAWGVGGGGQLLLLLLTRRKIKTWNFLIIKTPEIEYIVYKVDKAHTKQKTKQIQAEIVTLESSGNVRDLKVWRIYKYGTTETGVWSSHIINNLIHEYAELLLNKFRNVFQSYHRKTKYILKNKFMLSARNLLIEKQNTMAHTSKELNVLMH